MTRHTVNLRSDGPVTSKIVKNGDTVCLSFTSRKQTVDVVLTAEQWEEVSDPDVEEVGKKTKSTKKKTTATKKTTPTKKTATGGEAGSN